MGFLLFLSILITIIVVGLFVWLITVIFREERKPQDFTIIDNFMSQYTEGFSQGILLRVDIGEKRNGYEYIPKDIDHYGRRRQKNKSKIESQLIYADKRHVISFPRGTFSSERNRIWILPLNPEDLNEELKSTKLGKVIMKMINDINNEKTEIDSIREGSDRMKSIIKRLGDGELSELEIERLDTIHDNLIKNMARTEDKKITIGSPSTHTP